MAGLDSTTSTIPGSKQMFKSELNSDHSKDPPRVTPQLDDEQVKGRPGFSIQHHLLTYIFIVYNGECNR